MTKRKRTRSQYRKNKRTQMRSSSVTAASPHGSRRGSNASNASSNISALVRFASQAAGANVGAAVGGFPGAVAGDYVAGRAYDYVTSRPPTYPQKNSMSNGYSGRLNKAKSGKDVMQKALQVGSVAQIEQYGNVKDPHCVYITHSTFQQNSISYAVRFALIRKVFQKAGIRVINRFEELALFAPGNSDGFKLEYVYGDSLNGGYASVSYVTVDNQTLTTVVNSFTAFATQFNEFMDSNDGKQPFSLNLYASDRDALLTNWRLLGNVQISDEEMHIQISSCIKVQNRTAGDLAGAGDLNTERTDCQPVVVKGFQFMNADPRTRAQQNGLGSIENNYAVLNGVPLNNIRLLRGGTEFGTGEAFQNTPPKSIFNNCSKVSTSILQPGAMKQSTIYYSAKGRGLNFFKKLQFNLLTSGLVAQTLGRSEMLVFEEKMRTVGTNPVSIHYERKYSVGCYSLTKKGGSIVPFFTSQELNLG